jgi:hypothetical protein
MATPVVPTLLSDKNTVADDVAVEQSTTTTTPTPTTTEGSSEVSRSVAYIHIV